MNDPVTESAFCPRDLCPACEREHTLIAMESLDMGVPVLVTCSACGWTA
jgi:Zn ribbon nucleic-acid-binding protein